MQAPGQPPLNAPEPPPIATEPQTAPREQGSAEIAYGLVPAHRHGVERPHAGEQPHVVDCIKPPATVPALPHVADPESTATISGRPDVLTPPRLIRVELTFEPAEYAIVEAALGLMRAQGNGRRREALVVAMAQRVLTVPAQATVSEINPKQPYQPEAEKASHRRSLGDSVERTVLERAGFMCERCGRRQALQIHHQQRVCKGGTNDPSRLSLLCGTCHCSEHDAEFHADPRFIHGRQNAIARRQQRGPQGS